MYFSVVKDKSQLPPAAKAFGGDLGNKARQGYSINKK